MTARFKKAYDKLVKAYLNNELKAGDCSACAVGTLCGHPHWKAFFLTPKYGGQLMNIYDNKTVYKATGKSKRYWKKQMELDTGYSVNELSLIENTFEKNTEYIYDQYRGINPSQIDTDQFNGLSAVIDVMMKLDGMDVSKDDLMQPFKNKLQPAHP